MQDYEQTEENMMEIIDQLAQYGGQTGSSIQLSSRGFLSGIGKATKDFGNGASNLVKSLWDKIKG